MTGALGGGMKATFFVFGFLSVFWPTTSKSSS